MKHTRGGSLIPYGIGRILIGKSPALPANYAESYHGYQNSWEDENPWADVCFVGKIIKPEAHDIPSDRADQDKSND